ncbi:hypothetical protein XENOCAPTIV_010225 [Xenoophorus captivus]|uniref:Uncharacterized protein n=1 Tax=Xenoophorus captivus TaxID=1517983 RepID=A0ABV0SEF7_9TELE
MQLSSSISLFLWVTFNLYASAVVNENVSLVISRQLLTDFCTHLPNLPDATAKAVRFPFQVCYARVLDFRRKFIEAAQRYNELSYKSIVHESERLEALKHALNCTILASAGTLNMSFVYIVRNHLISSFPTSNLVFDLLQDSSVPACWPLCSKMSAVSSWLLMGFWRRCT